MDELPSPRLGAAIWRYRVSSLVIVGVAVLFSVLVALVVGESARMQARLALKTPDQAGVLGVEATGESAFTRYVNQRSLFVTSEQVLSGAAKKLPDVDLEDLRDAVTAEPSVNGESIVIEVSAGAPEDAAAVMREVIASYRAASLAETEDRVGGLLAILTERRKDIENTLEQASAGRDRSVNAEAAVVSIGELDQRITELKVAANQVGDGVAFVYDAEPDSTALLRAVARDGVVGLGLGGLLAAAVAWFRADRDRRIGEPHELADAVDAPVLGEIEIVPEGDARSLRWLGTSPTTAYRLLAFGLRRIIDRGVVVLTGDPDSGVTTTTLQVAAALAREGDRVLVVDAAVRSHGLSSSVGLAPGGGYDRQDHPGFTDVAMGVVSARDVMRSIELTDGITLTVMPCGSIGDESGSRLRAQLIELVISQLRSEFDIVLVDAPHPASAPESSIIVRSADAAVLVVRHGAPVSAVRRLADQITLVGGVFSGSVLTFAPRRSG